MKSKTAHRAQYRKAMTGGIVLSALAHVAALAYYAVPQYAGADETAEAQTRPDNSLDGMRLVVLEEVQPEQPQAAAQASAPAAASSAAAPASSARARLDRPDIVERVVIAAALTPVEARLADASSSQPVVFAGITPNTPVHTPMADAEEEKKGGGWGNLLGVLGAGINGAICAPDGSPQGVAISFGGRR
ncbi:MAG: hypothetical protein RQ751_09195 [Longimicrobiales bacterium]|nr:hypothetical protein [Longimicrobiales bacterium]